MSEPGQEDALEPRERTFLVVVDETEEMRTALRYACRRAQHTDGRVALMHAIEPVEFQHWIGVGRVMEEEARQEAEQMMQALAQEVFELTGKMPTIHIREGARRDELLALIDEEPTISLLVLATATEASNPGPLVSYLITSMGDRLRVPVTLVPGHLGPEEIDALS